MKKTGKMAARTKIIEAMRALPTEEARRKWAEKLGSVLYEMQRGKN